MIELRQVSIQAGDFSLRDLSFTVPSGSYAALMGKTGSGKTTILEAIAGLKKVRSGHVLLGGRDVTTLQPAVRGIGYVPQDAALFSTMTVAEHLEFALEIRKVPRKTRQERVRELADLLAIEHLLQRLPDNLSGGERQRVALGRAISFGPGTLLFDEPLSALDEDTREEMQALLKTVQAHSGATVLHITHDRNEARKLADQLLEIRAGDVVSLNFSLNKRSTPSPQAREHLEKDPPAARQNEVEGIPKR